MQNKFHSGDIFRRRLGIIDTAGQQENDEPAQLLNVD